MHNIFGSFIQHSGSAPKTNLGVSIVLKNLQRITVSKGNSYRLALDVLLHFAPESLDVAAQQTYHIRKSNFLCLLVLSHYFNVAHRTWYAFYTLFYDDDDDDDNFRIFSQRHFCEEWHKNFEIIPAVISKSTVAVKEWNFKIMCFTETSKPQQNLMGFPPSEKCREPPRFHYIAEQ